MSKRDSEQNSPPVQNNNKRRRTSKLRIAPAANLCCYICQETIPDFGITIGAAEESQHAQPRIFHFYCIPWHMYINEFELHKDECYAKQDKATQFKIYFDISAAICQKTREEQHLEPELSKIYEAIDSKLAQNFKLRRVQVSMSRGNCIFLTFAHQRFYVDLNKESISQDENRLEAEELASKFFKYALSNKHIYLPMYKIINVDANEDQFIQECYDFCSKDHSWATDFGDLAIKILADMLEKTVIVHIFTSSARHFTVTVLPCSSPNNSNAKPYNICYLYGIHYDPLIENPHAVTAPLLDLFHDDHDAAQTPPAPQYRGITSTLLSNDAVVGKRVFSQKSLKEQGIKHYANIRAVEKDTRYKWDDWTKRFFKRLWDAANATQTGPTAEELHLREAEYDILTKCLDLQKISGKSEYIWHGHFMYNVIKPLTNSDKFDFDGNVNFYFHSNPSEGKASKPDHMSGLKKADLPNSARLPKTYDIPTHGNQESELCLVWNIGEQKKENNGTSDRNKVPLQCAEAVRHQHHLIKAIYDTTGQAPQASIKLPICTGLYFDGASVTASVVVALPWAEDEQQVDLIWFELPTLNCSLEAHLYALLHIIKEFRAFGIAFSKAIEELITGTIESGHAATPSSYGKLSCNQSSKQFHRRSSDDYDEDNDVHHNARRHLGFDNADNDNNNSGSNNGSSATGSRSSSPNSTNNNNNNQRRRQRPLSDPTAYDSLIEKPLDKAGGETYCVSRQIHESCRSIVLEAVQTDENGRGGHHVIIKLCKSSRIKNELRVLRSICNLSVAPRLISSLRFPWKDTTYKALVLERIKTNDRFYHSELHVKSYLKQLLQLLCKLHGASVVHRDIKESNVLFDVHGKCYLIDFELAVINTPEPPLVRLGEGTVGYIAPEAVPMVAEWGTVTPAVDIFATGVMFIKLLLGVQILYPNDITELCSKTTAEASLRWVYDTFLVRCPAHPQLWTQAVYNLVRSMIDVHPENRPSARDALHQISRIWG